MPAKNGLPHGNSDSQIGAETVSFIPMGREITDIAEKGYQESIAEDIKAFATHKEWPLPLCRRWRHLPLSKGLRKGHFVLLYVFLGNPLRGWLWLNDLIPR